MSIEKTYRFKTLAALARKVASGQLTSDQVSLFVLIEEPDDVIAEVDTCGPIGPISGKQVASLHVLPGPHAAEVAERIWEWLGWDEIEEDAKDPSELDVGRLGWYLRYHIYY